MQYDGSGNVNTTYGLVNVNIGTVVDTYVLSDVLDVTTTSSLVCITPFSFSRPIIIMNI